MQTRPCWVEISTSSFEHNFRFLASLAAPHAELLAIVKADAYGHGLSLCAPAAARAGARWLGVTSVEEAITARSLCLEPRTRDPHRQVFVDEVEILVISGIFPGQGTDVIRHRLTPVVWEPWQLDELESAAHVAGIGATSLPVHLEIDTGMSRQGTSIDGLPHLLKRFTSGSPLRLEGAMTHLFAADEANGLVTREQFAQLRRALDHVAAAGLHPQWLNVGNSAALLAGKSSAVAELAARYKMKPLIRPGLALYGIAPHYEPAFTPSEPAMLAKARQQLQPVMTWKSKVATVRAVPPGTSVGYNGTFVATEPMRLALIAAGYADGLDRRLGNRFSLLVRGQRAPLVGRISMDQAVLDVTEIPGVEAGDEVVMVGTQGDETITVSDHAETTGTIPWEVFTRIGSRVPRISV